MKKAIQRWEIAGIVFIILIGSLLHFVFEWAGYWRPMALVVPVNESTWEHFKLGFWPALVWALIELPFIRKQANNFGIAKAAGLLAMPIVTAALFYGYTFIMGENFLIADILTFVVAVIVGQWISMRLLTMDEIRIPWLRGLGIAILTIMTLAFLTLSYFPPRNFLFEHLDTGQYGILSDYGDHEH